MQWAQACCSAVANQFAEKLLPFVVLYETCAAFPCSLAPLIVSEHNVFRLVVLRAQKGRDHKKRRICCSELLVSLKGACILKRDVRGTRYLSECGEVPVHELLWPLVKRFAGTAHYASFCCSASTVFPFPLHSLTFYGPLSQLS
jgi:hypothetical protein